MLMADRRTFDHLSLVLAAITSLGAMWLFAQLLICGVQALTLGLLPFR